MKNNRSILITGASTGIGKACALTLDEKGDKVYAGVRKEEDEDALCREASGKLVPIILDVTKGDTIARAAELISADTDYPLYGLVNNAGIGISGVVEATPESELRNLLEVNVIGLHAVTRAMLPMLRKNKGRIINVGSSASFMASPGGSSYAASKFAVRAITESLALEMKPFGVSVSLVAPGAIESEIWGKSKAYKKKLRENAGPELLEVYKLFVRAGDNMVKTIKPRPAAEAVSSVMHGLFASKPKPVYLVGNDAKKAYKFSRMPKGLFNWLVMKHITKIAGKD
jgi:NAD(P)-dependent dehydrogenase (short-subunit alcohol dehydrogenase family)